MLRLHGNSWLCFRGDQAVVSNSIFPIRTKLSRQTPELMNKPLGYFKRPNEDMPSMLYKQYPPSKKQSNLYRYNDTYSQTHPQEQNIQKQINQMSYFDFNKNEQFPNPLLYRTPPLELSGQYSRFDNLTPSKQFSQYLNGSIQKSLNNSIISEKSMRPENSKASIELSQNQYIPSSILDGSDKSDSTENYDLVKIKKPILKRKTFSVEKHSGDQAASTPLVKHKAIRQRFQPKKVTGKKPIVKKITPVIPRRIFAKNRLPYVRKQMQLKQQEDIEFEQSKRHWKRREQMLSDYESRDFYRYELPTICRLIHSRIPEMYSPPCLSTTPMYEIALAKS